MSETEVIEVPQGDAAPAGDVTPDIVVPETPATPEGQPSPVPDADVVPQIPEGELDDNWRSRMSGGDDKKLGQLERYGSEEAVVDALLAAKQKLRSGEMTPKLGDNPSDEDLSSYRKEMGIPETFEEYEYKLPEGFSFGEADKPFLDNALKAMHGANATPDQINAMLNAYAGNVEDQALQYTAKDASDKEATEDALRSEWGNEFRANKNMVENFLSTAPDDVREMLLNGRGADNTAFMNNPGMVRWLNGITREINPAASVVKMTGRDTIQNVNDEIAILKTEMDSNIDQWHKSPEKKARYQVLLGAKEKLEARKA